MPHDFQTKLLCKKNNFLGRLGGYPFGPSFLFFLMSNFFFFFFLFSSFFFFFLFFSSFFFFFFFFLFSFFFSFSFFFFLFSFFFFSFFLFLFFFFSFFLFFLFFSFFFFSYFFFSFFFIFLFSFFSLQKRAPSDAVGTWVGGVFASQQRSAHAKRCQPRYTSVERLLNPKP